MEILRLYTKNPDASEEIKSTIQTLSQAVKNGNHSLIREILKNPSPNNLSGWAKHINSGDSRNDETGIITITMEYQNE
jgi:hypothetical protein